MTPIEQNLLYIRNALSRVTVSGEANLGLLLTSIKTVDKCLEILHAPAEEAQEDQPTE